jgi:hypothetical protein
VTRAAGALVKLETVVKNLARAAGDNSLDSRPRRLQFMRDTLGTLFLFRRWRWEEFSSFAEPFESSIDLREVDPNAIIDL